MKLGYTKLIDTLYNTSIFSSIRANMTSSDGMFFVLNTQHTGGGMYMIFNFNNQSCS